MNEHELPECIDYDSRFRRVIAKTGIGIFAFGTYSHILELNETQNTIANTSMLLGFVALSLPIIREWQEYRKPEREYNDDDDDDDWPDNGGEGDEPTPDIPDGPGGLAIDWDKEAESLFKEHVLVGVD